eukprot:1735141-Amphidinium_carterae.1
MPIANTNVPAGPVCCECCEVKMNSNHVGMLNQQELQILKLCQCPWKRQSRAAREAASASWQAITVRIFVLKRLQGNSGCVHMPVHRYLSQAAQRTIPCVCGQVLLEHLYRCLAHFGILGMCVC